MPVQRRPGTAGRPGDVGQHVTGPGRLADELGPAEGRRGVGVLGRPPGRGAVAVLGGQVGQLAACSASVGGCGAQLVDRLQHWLIMHRPCGTKRFVCRSSLVLDGAR